MRRASRGAHTASGDLKGMCCPIWMATSMFNDVNLNPALFYGSGYDNRTDGPFGIPRAGTSI
mgnify:CR=1 FL=1